MSRLAPSLCLCQLVQPPFDQEVDIILSRLTDLCRLDLMRKHISVKKNRKYSIYLLPWTHFSVLAGVKPRVHGGQIFCKLSLNIHIPISDPLIDPTTSSCRDLGTSEVVVGQVLRIGFILGPSRPRHGWAEDHAMLRWLRWNGDFSDHSLDCEVDLMGFQVTSYQWSLVCPHPLLPRMAESWSNSLETSKFFLRISRSRSSSLQLYCYMDTSSSWPINTKWITYKIT